MNERERFEKWASKERMDVETVDDDDYVSFETEVAWRAWQARGTGG